MRLLVWQWGRRGAGPKFAAELTTALGRLPGTEAMLSLSSGAEILAAPQPPHCDLKVATYQGVVGLAGRFLSAPTGIANLIRRLRPMRLDVAVCAMPGPLDLMLVAALAWLRVKLVVIVHDADPHPGDVMPLLMWLQRRLILRADMLVALSTHVAERLSQQGVAGADRPVVVLRHPPMPFGALPPPPFSHAGPPRLLFFGRLLAYKGIDLLNDALALLDPRSLEVRIVGSGPETKALAALRELPFVTVENRWISENEIAGIIAWADVLVLPYREASQSGAAAVAIAAGRWVVATRVGGLREQLSDENLAILCDPDAASLAAAMGGLCRTRPVPPDRDAGPEMAWQDFAAAMLARIAAETPGRN